MTLARRAALRAVAALEPIEADARVQIDALESELHLLAPYASTKGLMALRARLAELRSAIWRLKGLPLEAEP